jgi:membrane-bound lytic murein transglycosylase D
MQRCGFVTEWAFKVVYRFFAVLLAISVTGCSLISGKAPDIDGDQQAAIAALDYQNRPLSVPPLPAETRAEVQRELNWFLHDNRRHIVVAFDRIAEHYPKLQKVFVDEQVPDDLLSIGIVESKFDAHAKSRMGARGIWQFMPSTAKVYGLRVGVLRDERSDPILSSTAAVRHLRDLYRAYGDWVWALAAYNAGKGGIDRVRRRNPGLTFWQICAINGVRDETRRFVAKVLAVGKIIKFPAYFGFETYKENKDREEGSRR